MMKLSEMIAQAQELLKDHGDMDVLDSTHSSVYSLSLEVSDGSFPKDWNMPEGLKYVMSNSDV
jgi:hypothetical protein